MFGFLIVLAVSGAGLLFGVMMLVGLMFYSGKWTLPNSEQRRVQRATVELQIAKLNEERAEALFKASQTEANRVLMQIQADAKELELRAQLFNKQLEAGDASSTT